MNAGSRVKSAMLFASVIHWDVLFIQIIFSVYCYTPLSHEMLSGGDAPTTMATRELSSHITYDRLEWVDEIQMKPNARRVHKNLINKGLYKKKIKKIN